MNKDGAQSPGFNLSCPSLFDGDLQEVSAVSPPEIAISAKPTIEKTGSLFLCSVRAGVDKKAEHGEADV